MNTRKGTRVPIIETPRRVRTRLEPAVGVAGVIGLLALATLLYTHHLWAADLNELQPIGHHLAALQRSAIQIHLTLHQPATESASALSTKIEPQLERLRDYSGKLIGAGSPFLTFPPTTALPGVNMPPLDALAPAVEGFVERVRDRFKAVDDDPDAPFFDTKVSGAYSRMTDLVLAAEAQRNRQLNRLARRHHHLHLVNVGVWSAMLLALCGFLQLMSQRRRRAEDHLHRTDRIYRTILENLDTRVALIRSDMTLIMVTGKGLDTPSDQPPDGRTLPCYEAPTSDRTACGDCPGQRAMETGQVAMVEREHSLPDGTTRRVRIKACPVFEEDGSIQHFVEVIEDITKEQAQQRELEHDRDALAHRVADQRANLEATAQQLEPETRRSRSAEADLDRFFQLTSDLFCIVSKDGYFRTLNPAWEKLLGYTREELCAVPLVRFLHPDDVAPTEACLSQLREDRPIFNFDNRYRTREGRHVWLSWSAIPGPGEEVTYAVGRDITERKQIEDELHQHRQNLESLVAERTRELTQINTELQREVTERQRTQEGLHRSDSLLREVIETVPIGIWMLDHDLRIQLWNLQQEVMTRIARDTVMGRRLHESLPELSRCGLSDLFARVLERGEPLALMNYPLRDFGQSGRTRYYNISAKALRDERATVTGIVVCIEDITERRSAQDALCASEERYRKLYESSRDGFVLLDLQGRIVQFNSTYQDMLGFPPEQLQGKPYEELTPPRWHEMQRRLITEQVLTRGYSDLFEKEYLRADGTTFPIEVRLFLTRESGRPG